MMRRLAVMLACLLVLGGTAWLTGQGQNEATDDWTEVMAGVWRSPGQPTGYALVVGDRAWLIDAPTIPKIKGVDQVEKVLLTHHHRDSLAAVPLLTANVFAPKASAAYLDPKLVARYWREAIPLRNSRTAYLVIAKGLPTIVCSLSDGQTLTFGDWRIEVIATPGHSPDHVAYLAENTKDKKKLLFVGDALARRGKLWSPYTTDWDHWTDAGLRPAAESLRKLAKLEADLVLPARGPVIDRDIAQTCRFTAELIDENAFLRSYERYTRDRLKNPPKYRFLAPEQAGSNGSLPWSRLSKNLWLTGNTYVLRSKEGPCLVVDPWDPHSEKQIPKLQKDEQLGRVEVVLCSHAHFDHYDGTYVLLQRDKPEVWTLDEVARPLADPFRLRAPFLDARPLPIAKRLRDGETVRWREYELKFHFLPGQSLFTMGVETTIDGKRCLFTADNFFHHDLYSGTGGWMGLNRSGPTLYEQSARKVLALAPDWILAEHGSAMEFNAEDFQRRITWAQVSGKVADDLSGSGDHRHDWNPHHVRIEPILLRGQPGGSVSAELVVENLLKRSRKLSIQLDGHEPTWSVVVAPGKTHRQPIRLPLSNKLTTGRHVFTFTAREVQAVEPSDTFLIVDVAEKSNK